MAKKSIGQPPKNNELPKNPVGRPAKVVGIDPRDPPKPPVIKEWKCKTFADLCKVPPQFHLMMMKHFVQRVGIAARDKVFLDSFTYTEQGKVSSEFVLPVKQDPLA